MISVTNEAREKLNQLLVGEIRSYPDRYPDMLEEFTFAIVLSPIDSETCGWELLSSAVSNSMPPESFLISSGVQFHHPQIRNLDANIDLVDGNFIVNGDNARLSESKRV